MKNNASFWEYVQTYPRTSKRAITKPESPKPESGIGTRVAKYKLEREILEIERAVYNLDPKPIQKKSLPKSSIQMPDYGKDNSNNSPSQQAVLDYLISWHTWYARKYLGKP